MSSGKNEEPIDAEIVEPESGNTTGAGATNTSDWNPPEVPESDYNEGGVPSFDYVRNNIEQRYNTSSGMTEMAGMGTDQTIASVDKKIAERDAAAKDRLAEIRRSMGKE